MFILQTNTDGELVAVFSLENLSGSYDQALAVPRLDIFANGNK
jgi:hypothetical protein